MSSTQFLRDVLTGLSSFPRSIPCKYFYDERGSGLFDEICGLDEYYPTRTELAILRDHSEEMARAIGPGAVLIEYGSGSSLKTCILLDALPSPAAYVPVDISEEHLYRSASQLSRSYPDLDILPLASDFTKPLKLPELPAGKRVVYFSGSTIGNFEQEESSRLLRGISRLADCLLIGVDLRKPRKILEPAYNDARGVTAQFNLNLLARINRELGGNFDLGSWRHRAIFLPSRSRIEMRLQSLKQQSVSIQGRTFTFESGEEVLTELSHKYTLRSFASLCLQSGLKVDRVWKDPDGLFSVQLAHAA
jgi:dimethylhistidine N-methyltransferase